MLPVGYASKVNDQGFDAMAQSTMDYLKHFMYKDVLGTNYGSGLHSNESGGGAAGNDNGTGTADSAMQSASRLEDQTSFGPQQTMAAARIDRTAQAIYKNVAQERNFLNESEREYPRGVNPKLDALRKRTEDLITFQNTVADRYEAFAETYIMSSDYAEIASNSARDAANIKENLRGLLFGVAANITEDRTKPGPASNFGYRDAADLAKNGSSGQVVAAMRYQQYVFSSSLYDVYNQCHGTHFVLPPSPTPAPTRHGR